MRFQIKQIFSNFAYIQFEEAVNGVEALEKHRTFKPDVIILDYIIPAPDGVAVLKILSQIDKKVKIIMITTLGNQKFIYKECIECGAMATFTKPITTKNALKVIKIIKSQVS